MFLSSDKGRTWTPVVISSNVCEKGLPSFAITGVGFISSEHGFICFRQTICQGPEIYETKDGGVSWKRLEVSVPEEYGTPITVTAMSPIITSKSVCFPICLIGEEENHYQLYMSSTDFKEWNWSSDTLYF